MRPLALALALALACGDEPQPVPTPPPPPSFDVHEWGFIGAHVDDLGTDPIAWVAGAPPRPIPTDLGTTQRLGGGGGPHGGVGVVHGGHGIGKPVLYLHADEDLPYPVRVEVTATGGAILERLPAGTSTENGVRWSDLRVRASSCRSTRNVTSRDDAACATRDGYCEAIEDPGYDTDDAACLELPDGSSRNHLFYRAESTANVLPLAVTIDRESGRITVRNTSAEPIPGQLLRVAMSGDDVRFLTAAAPAPNAEITMEPAPSAPPGAADDAEPIPEPLRRTGDVERAFERLVAERGLTAAEVAVFLRAWGPTLWNAPTATSTTDAGRPPASLGRAQDALYYVMPDGSLGRALPLAIEPAPRHLRRAFLVRVQLDSRRSLGTVSADGTIGVGAYAAPGHVAIRIRALEVSGGLSPEVIRRIIRHHYGRLRFCWDRTTSSEDARLRFHITATGETDHSTSTSGNPALDECMQGALRAMRFPQPTRPVTVELTVAIER